MLWDNGIEKISPPTQSIKHNCRFIEAYWLIDWNWWFQITFRSIIIDLRCCEQGWKNLVFHEYYSQTDLTAADHITCRVMLDCRLQYFAEFACHLGLKCKFSWHKCQNSAMFLQTKLLFRKYSQTKIRFFHPWLWIPKNMCVNLNKFYKASVVTYIFTLT